MGVLIMTSRRSLVMSGSVLLSMLTGCGAEAERDQSLVDAVPENPAQENFRVVGSEGGIVEDTRTGLQWMRCSVGQVWTGRTCSDGFEWDCRSDILGADHLCDMPMPEAGTWWVKLDAVSGFSEVSLTGVVSFLDSADVDEATDEATDEETDEETDEATDDAGDEDTQSLVVTETILDETRLAGQEGGSLVYGITVPQDAVNLSVTTTAGQGDLHLLLVRRDQLDLPTLSKTEAWAVQASYGGYTDWRLPTAEELDSLVYCSSNERAGFDENGIGGQCQGTFQRPTILTGWFPNTPATSYWTSSDFRYFTDFAWNIHFDTGAVGSPTESDTRHVRLVRGGR